METETFGAFASSLFVILLFLLRPEHRRRDQVLCAIPFFFAVFFKEPFLLTMCAAGLLLCRSRRDLLHRIVIPACIGGIIAMLAMLLSGWLGPYLRIHLPLMLFERHILQFNVPTYVQALDPYPLFVNVNSSFRSAPLFGILIILLCVWSPLFRTNKRGAGATVLAFCACLLGAILLRKVTILVDGQILAVQGKLFEDAILIPDALLWVWASGPVFVALVVMLWSRKLLGHAAVALIVLYVTSFTVVTSGYTGNHFAVIVPVVIALTLLWARYEGQSWNPLTFGTIVIVMCGALGMYMITEKQERFWEESKTNTQLTAEDRLAYARFDDLMDACDIDQFQGPIQASIYGRHTLWGPLPRPENFQNLGSDHPLQKSTRENLANRNTVILTKGEPNAPVKNFTKQAPACAKAFLPLSGYTVLFRTPWPSS